MYVFFFFFLSSFCPEFQVKHIEMASSVHSTNGVSHGDKETGIRSMSSSRNQGQSDRYIHKVSAPPKQNLFQEFKSTVKETFFADDPLRSFKDQSKSRKFVLGVQAIFPILEWSRRYSFKKFRGDLIAGLTIASLCIPQVHIIQLALPG